MAVTNAGSTPLTFTNLPIGVQVTKITDTSADWASVANSTYFYDKGDGLVHFKNSSGVVLELFSAGGLTYFTEAENTSAPNATVPVNSLSATGAATNIDAAIVPKGTGAFTLDIADNTTAGGNKRGANAIDLQTTRIAATNVASGTQSVVIGSNSTASGAIAVAIGDQALASNSYATAFSLSTASGQRTFAFGFQATASGNYAVALGGNSSGASTASGINSVVIGMNNIASGQYSVAIGLGNTSNAINSFALGRSSSAFSVSGRQVYASGREAADGDAQTSKFVLRERTTDNTATTLTTNSSAAATTNQVILSNQSAYRFKGSIIGKQSGTTDTAAWDIDGLIVRGANAASTTLVVSNVNVVDNTPTWGTPTLAADTTNGGLQVQVIGAAATNIQWTAVIETTEVIYA